MYSPEAGRPYDKDIDYQMRRSSRPTETIPCWRCRVASSAVAGDVVWRPRPLLRRRPWPNFEWDATAGVASMSDCWWPVMWLIVTICDRWCGCVTAVTVMGIPARPGSDMMNNLMLDHRWLVRSWVGLPVVGSFLCYIPGCRFGITVDYRWPVQLYYYTISHSTIIGEGVPLSSIFPILDTRSAGGRAIRWPGIFYDCSPDVCVVPVWRLFWWGGHADAATVLLLSAATVPTLQLHYPARCQAVSMQPLTIGRRSSSRCFLDGPDWWLWPPVLIPISCQMQFRPSFTFMSLRRISMCRRLRFRPRRLCQTVIAVCWHCCSIVHRPGRRYMIRWRRTARSTAQRIVRGSDAGSTFSNGFR